MRHVHDHSQAVELGHELAAEPAESGVAGLLAPVRGRAAHVVGQLDDAHSEPPVDFGQVQIVLERAGSLEVQHDGQLAVVLGRTDVGSPGGNAERVVFPHQPEDFAEPVHCLAAALPGSDADHAGTRAAGSPGRDSLAPVLARAGPVYDD